tara:strand:- start:413 stop:724 length:312 start_codon:yes stop_codon:yes gene_type:complete
MVQNYSIYVLCGQLTKTPAPQGEDKARVLELLGNISNAPIEDIIWFKEKLFIPEYCRIRTSDHYGFLDVGIRPGYVKEDEENLFVTLSVACEPHDHKATIPWG